MSEFTQSVETLRARYSRKLELEKEIVELEEEVKDDQEEFCSMLEALTYIGAVTESNTNKVLDFVTGVINNVLAKAFPYDKHTITLKRNLYRDIYTHINLVLTNQDGKKRNIAIQNGVGLKQIVSFLFTVTLIEVRKERKLLIADELLSGLHSVVKKIMLDIMEMFTKDGFQFIMVEYGMNEGGKVYLVEKKSSIATCSEYQGAYLDDVIFSEESDEEPFTEKEEYEASEKI